MLFDRLIRLLLRRRSAAPDVGPLTRQASGLVDWPQDETDRDILADALISKHVRTSRDGWPCSPPAIDD